MTRTRSVSRSTPRLQIAPASRSYLALLNEFPLRPIRSAAEAALAETIVHRLAMQQSALDAGQEEYLAVLEGLIERYDADHHAMDLDDVSPTEALRVLVEQAGMTVTQLGKLLGSKGAASELLSGKRKEPSKSQIAALSARFRVDAGVFLTPARQRARAA